MDLLRTELVDADPPVLKVDGELDLSTVDQLSAALDEAFAGHGKVVLDLAGLTFFDVVGLRVMLEMVHRRDDAPALELVNAARVERVLELVGLAGSESVVIVDGGAAGDR